MVGLWLTRSLSTSLVSTIVVHPATTDFTVPRLTIASLRAHSFAPTAPSRIVRRALDLARISLRPARPGFRNEEEEWTLTNERL
jgi:hypothetical protein